MTEALRSAYDALFTVALIVLAIPVFACMVRTIIGPRIADRMVAVNMISTMVISTIAILAMKFGENYLLDICLIYAVLGFIAVIVLNKVYLGIHAQSKMAARKEREGDEHDA